MPTKFFGIYRSPEYLAWIRCNACELCGSAVTQAHHEPLGENYVGGKPPDSHAIPLCGRCHQLRHEKGPGWLASQINVERRIIKYLTWYIKELEAKHGKSRP